MSPHFLMIEMKDHSDTHNYVYTLSKSDSHTRYRVEFCCLKEIRKKRNITKTKNKKRNIKNRKKNKKGMHRNPLLHTHFSTHFVCVNGAHNTRYFNLLLILLALINNEQMDEMEFEMKEREGMMKIKKKRRKKRKRIKQKKIHLE